jgi:hypothetical protein
MRESPGEGRSRISLRCIRATSGYLRQKRRDQDIE